MNGFIYVCTSLWIVPSLWTCILDRFWPYLHLVQLIANIIIKQEVLSKQRYQTRGKSSLKLSDFFFFIYSMISSAVHPLSDSSLSRNAVSKISNSLINLKAFFLIKTSFSVKAACLYIVPKPAGSLIFSGPSRLFWLLESNSLNSLNLLWRWTPASCIYWSMYLESWW